MSRNDYIYLALLLMLFAFLAYQGHWVYSNAQCQTACEALGYEKGEADHLDHSVCTCWVSTTRIEL